MNRLFGVLGLALVSGSLSASAQDTAQLFCHRTANQDVPENTLESLEEAALLGCNVVEIDLRRTFDGEIVLNHDGILERLSDGTGTVESADFAELNQLDFGSWMSPQFAGMRIARFEDALRLAHKFNIDLVLDIKTKGIGAQVLQILQREDMMDHVTFGGEWDDIKQIDPKAARGGRDVWLQPGATREQIDQLHQQGKRVVVNFSANDHEMDLDGMRAAVAAGADAINVDYPRLGADAVGRPVELQIQKLMTEANTDDSESRVRAIYQLSRYRGFSFTDELAGWLVADDPHVSRAAAVVLVAQPSGAKAILLSALHSRSSHVRGNALWALGMLREDSRLIQPYLRDPEASVQVAALLALGRASGSVPLPTLLSLLHSKNPQLRSAAALAIAHHPSALGLQSIRAQLRKEIAEERVLFDDRKRRGDPPFTQQVIDSVMRSFRCQMLMVKAISLIYGGEATDVLVSQALRLEKDFAQYDAIVSGFQLWNRPGLKPALLIHALGSGNVDLADRAEWTLVHADRSIAPDLRFALDDPSMQVRLRIIRILAWRADLAAIPKLEAIQSSAGKEESSLARWAVQTIRTMHSTQ